MRRPDTLAIVNERAGAGAMADLFRRLEHDLEAALGPFDVAFTDHPGHATALAREALVEGYTRVLVGGGDGTANEVVNGFFDPDAAPYAARARLGLISGGTGGDFRKTLGLRTREDALRALVADVARPTDVGRLTYRGPDGADVTRHFLNIASFGLSGETDRFIPAFKRLGGKAAYVGATLRALWGWSNPRVRLTVDGAPSFDGPACTVAVANGRYFGGGMMVCPDAEPDDGLFTVGILGDLGRLELVAQTGKIYSGRHVAHPKVLMLTARDVYAESDSPVYLDVDGEALGQLPARFELLPGALMLIR